MASELKVGDRVIVTENYANGAGSAGVLKSTDTSTDSACAIEFDDKFIGGHECNGHCKKGYGWWTPKSHIVKEGTPGLKNSLLEKRAKFLKAKIETLENTIQYLTKERASVIRSRRELYEALEKVS